MRILLVDDDKTTRHMLQYMTQKWGYEVITCADGREAWLTLKNDPKPPSIMLLDWMMPHIDGLEICQMVRNANIPVYIIMLTSKHGAEDLDKILEAGADDYLPKGSHADELYLRLNNATKILTLQEQLKSYEGPLWQHLLYRFKHHRQKYFQG